MPRLYGRKMAYSRKHVTKFGSLFQIGNENCVLGKSRAFAVKSVQKLSGTAQSLRCVKTELAGKDSFGRRGFPIREAFTTADCDLANAQVYFGRDSDRAVPRSIVPPGVGANGGRRILGRIGFAGVRASCWSRRTVSTLVDNTSHVLPGMRAGSTLRMAVMSDRKCLSPPERIGP